MALSLEGHTARAFDGDLSALHLQAVSEPYSEYGADDNHGCHYADPELGLSWPASPTLVSSEAMNYPSLSRLREQVHPLWAR